MGRLSVNILLSVARVECEIMGERISDKIAAKRQIGLWYSGLPVLCYDVDRCRKAFMVFAVSATAGYCGTGMGIPSLRPAIARYVCISTWVEMVCVDPSMSKNKAPPV